MPPHEVNFTLTDKTFQVVESCPVCCDKFTFEIYMEMHFGDCMTSLHGKVPSK